MWWCFQSLEELQNSFSIILIGSVINTNQFFVTILCFDFETSCDFALELEPSDYIFTYFRGKAAGKHSSVHLSNFFASHWFTISLTIQSSGLVCSKHFIDFRRTLVLRCCFLFHWIYGVRRDVKFSLRYEKSTLINFIPVAPEFPHIHPDQIWKLTNAWPVCVKGTHRSHARQLLCHPRTPIWSATWQLRRWHSLLLRLFWAICQVHIHMNEPIQAMVRPILYFCPYRILCFPIFNFH